MQHPWRPALRSASGAVALEWSTDGSRDTDRWWVESYAQRIARIADVDDVAIHHLDGGLVLVEVVAPPRVGPDPGDLTRGRHEARVPMAGQVTSRGSVVMTSTGASVGGRAVLVTAHRDGDDSARRSAFVDRVIVALAAMPGVRSVRAHVTDGRQGDSILGDVVIVEARDADSADAALRAVIGDEAAIAEPRVCTVRETQILREGGRVLLPADRPVRRPALDPRRRPVPPPPATSPARPLPASRVIDIPAGFAEDVVVDSEGMLLCGVDGGAILRVDPTTHAVSTAASTGGRPLGLEHRPDNTLLVCDAHLGLLHLDLTTGELTTLARFVDSRPLRFCSNATTLDDGTIWFTESTTRFDFEHHRGSLMENRPSGRLLRRTPDGTVTVLRDDLWFANGITRTVDGFALLVVETAAHQVSRVALSGPRAGAIDVVTADLPGFPDNMSAFREGRAWIPLTNPRLKALEMLGIAPRWVSQVAWRLPERLRPEPDHTVWAVAVDEHGDVVDEVHGTHPDFHTATGAVEVDGKLFLSSVFCAPMLEIDLGAR